MHAISDLESEMTIMYPALIRYARLLTRNQTEAEDLVQEALVKVLSRRNVRDIEWLQAYMRRVISNEFIRSSRQRKRHLVNWTNAIDPIENVPHDVVSERDEILQALDCLTPRQRVAVVSRYFLDLSEQQTAKAMHCSLGTVKSLTSRGLARMRDVLQIQEDMRSKYAQPRRI